MQASNSGFLQPSPAASSQNLLTPESGLSLSLSDFGTAEGDDSVYYTVNNSDYSTTLEGILSEDGDPADRDPLRDFEDDEDDEMFVYNGVDAAESGDYKSQLKDVLGDDAVSDSEAEVERSFSLSVAEREDGDDSYEFSYEKESKLLQNSILEEKSDTSMIVPTITVSPSPSKIVKRSYVHPTLSRLRYLVPKTNMSDSPDASIMSPLDSSHSTVSRRSSILSEFTHANGDRALPREAFKWAPLKVINSQIFASNKANPDTSIEHGDPTVIATNGLICVGTQKGRVLVFDFKQKLRYICGATPTAQEQGAVTAVALSQDHTFVAVGHASGFIFLYNLEKPNVPARSVPTTTISAVASGQKEGHLANSRISRIGFVGKRHTAIISSDENGLAFYHSLGKVLFIEANDVLRILGKYPNRASRSQSRNGEDPPPRKSTTILAMVPLPLGGIPDPVDEYNLTALLTPVKLVIVGLKPSPRTWYRQHRGDSIPSPESRWRGCLAWQPLIKISDPDEGEKSRTKKSVAKSMSKEPQINSKLKARPLLVFSWGCECHVLAVREEVNTVMMTNPRTGKTLLVNNGKILFEEQVRWSASQDLIALRWLNPGFVVGVTISHAIQVWDVRTGNLVESSSLGSLLVCWSPLTGDRISKPLQLGDDYGQSLHTYKDKVFLLHHNRLVVGSLLHWTDRILAYVQEGDFLSSIDLTRSYYIGEAPGNQIGLPDDAIARRQVLGLKLKELMVASIAYCFSEERLTDQTHVTPDGRGVDRTSLFENLVTSCAKSCIELGDLDFLYEELYERYNDWGITSIFLVRLEPFILENQITYVPPRITQRIIARHVEREDLSGAERLIWHIDPQCLDIDQAINLCKREDLWDALIYVYCAALHDYVSPIVELLGLIRWMLRLNESSQSGILLEPLEDSRLEKLTPVSYKLFPYLSNVLCGLRYPSQLPLDKVDALNAKEEIYAFLFSGRSAVWPKGESGELITTALTEGGIEPTYPYLRLLLRFDAESFLSTLDIAFEDSFLNEGSGHVNRLLIVKILLDVQDSTDLHSDDITLINIFVARNVPKYPQYLGHLPPSMLQTVLLSLIEDRNSETVETRQLASEFLLSAFRPHRTNELENKMREAGFYRVLRSWYRQDHKWPELLGAYVEDMSIASPTLVEDIDMVLRNTRPNDRLESVFLKAIPRLTDQCLTETASLVDRHMPLLHGRLLTLIGSDHPYQQLAYLQFLIEYNETGSKSLHSSHLEDEHREKYLDLLCHLQPEKVLHALKHFFPSSTKWDSLEKICLDSHDYSAAVWCIYARQDLEETFAKLDAYNNNIAESLLQQLESSDSLSTGINVTKSLKTLKSIQSVALEICERQSSDQGFESAFPTEDMWLKTLAAQINIVQTVSSQKLTEHSNPNPREEALQTLRSFVKDTLAARMRVGSADSSEFPNLFKRLVDATASTRSNSESSYSEFRLILGEMLTSYRTEEGLLESVNVLSGKDLVETIKQVAKARNRGWTPTRSLCPTCNSTIHTPKQLLVEKLKPKIIVSRMGIVYHGDCFTSV